MNLFQAISDFLESIFNRNSPEVQKKLQLRKLETEIRTFQPQIFINGNFNANFAEAIRLLYINSKPLSNLFLATISSPDTQKAHRFEAQLVLTGFSPSDQQEIAKLSYEGRRKELAESSMTTSQIFDRQRRVFEKMIHLLNNDNFRKIDKNLISLHQFADLCRFNYVTILQIFDSGFVAADPTYKPSFQPVAGVRLTNVLEDLYYQVNGLVISGSILNAIAALHQLHFGSESTNEEVQKLFKNVKAISYIFNKVLTPDKIKVLIRYEKQDIVYEPKSVVYKESASRNFEQMMSAKFKADEQRIKTEMSDENIRSEISKLFKDTPLVSVKGYNNDFNKKLIANSQGSFLWVLPMEILKTFISVYLTEPIRSLLNDIVIEGFFNNPNYKTEFSTDVYSAIEIPQSIADFEELFSAGNKYSIAVLEGYLNDGKNDIDFLKKLGTLVNDINSDANKILSQGTNSLYHLYKHIGDLLNDSKKPTSEIISNLKILMMSSRNRDNTYQLEQQYDSWEIFFKIMKNYVIINA